MIYTSKPQQVEAVQWTGSNEAAVEALAQGRARVTYHVAAGWTVELLAGKDGAQGWVPVPVGHWIVHAPGDKTDMWPVEDAYFKAKYEAGDTALPKLRKLEGWYQEHVTYPDGNTRLDVCRKGETGRLTPGVHSWPDGEHLMTITHHDVYVSDIPRPIGDAGGGT